MIRLLADLAASKAPRDPTNVVLPGDKGAMTSVPLHIVGSHGAWGDHDIMLGHDNGEKLWDTGGREGWVSMWRNCTG